MKTQMIKALVLGSWCCTLLLSSCNDSPKAGGFGPVPHEKEIEELIEKAE